MKSRINYLIIILLIFSSCNQKNDKEKELEFKEKELNIKQKEIEIKEKENQHNLIENENQQTTKWLYFIVKTKELCENADSIKICNYQFTSDIIEIKNYNEDKKYFEIDKFKLKVNEYIKQRKENLINEIAKIPPLKYMVDGYPTWIYEFKPKILDCESFEYISYKDASISRQNMTSDLE
jgi:hypothetical protein